MSETETLERIARLLEEIRDGQRIQLERQTETLALQKEQFQRTQKLQDRAEAIQDRSAQLVGACTGSCRSRWRWWSS
jgi:hypothetical protein